MADNDDTTQDSGSQTPGGPASGEESARERLARKRRERSEQSAGATQEASSASSPPLPGGAGSGRRPSTLRGRGIAANRVARIDPPDDDDDDDDDETEAEAHAREIAELQKKYFLWAGVACVAFLTLGIAIGGGAGALLGLVPKDEVRETVVIFGTILSTIVLGILSVLKPDAPIQMVDGQGGGRLGRDRGGRFGGRLGGGAGRFGARPNENGEPGGGRFRSSGRRGSRLGGRVRP